MSGEHAIGELYAALDGDQLRSDAARRVRAALKRDGAYALRAYGRWTSDGVDFDILIVECTNERVPSRNAAGINVRESLALLFPSASSGMPQVRALRHGFPLVPHLNHVSEGEPVALCLYFEPWTAVERAWTPQRFLERIRWWLLETALGTLHRADQPVEQLYFNSPIDLVLAPNFHSKITDPSLSMVIGSIDRDNGYRTFRTMFVPKRELEKIKGATTTALVLLLPAVVHGRIELLPPTLGALHDQLVARGSSLVEQLREAIREQTPSKGLERRSDGACLLILRVPIRRAADAAPEREQLRGCYLPLDITQLGEACDVLFLHNKLYHAAPIIGGGPTTGPERWRDIQLCPLDISNGLTVEQARLASAVGFDGADAPRVLAGVGALGSTLADIWAREAWGRWTYVDDDYLKPHNVARHAAKDLDIGHYKVDAVVDLTQRNFQDDHYRSQAFHMSILSQNESALVEALQRAVLVVDATTTLEVPRDLALRDDLCRSVSVFLTPSGLGAVLLLEDEERRVRLDALEAQYYRAILGSPWGEVHLRGSRGHLWVGAGCRDLSAVISTEHVHLLGGVLARQVRLQSGRPAACARVWHLDPESSALSLSEITLSLPVVRTLCGWTVVSDVAIETKLAQLRRKHLPRETAGLIFGYSDHKLKKLFVVDVLPAPPDTEGDATGVSRGVIGTLDAVTAVRARTGGVVGYLGEWHSHPPFAPPCPSADDRVQIGYVAQELARVGEPALMIIVGCEGEVSYTVHTVE